MKMDQEPDYGDPPLPPPTREEEEAEAWEYWHQRTLMLEGALFRLSNEVLGSLPLMEELCRREFGNTNYAILIQRAEEGRALAGDRRAHKTAERET